MLSNGWNQRKQQYDFISAVTKEQKKIFVLFVSSWLIFRRNLHAALRRLETMKIAGRDVRQAASLSRLRQVAY
ncbi:MAG: hypothetical protein ACREA2_00330, partial [Blastocatellia bacterium]